MQNWIKSLQISFTYIGTMVGAGFASGREILTFFTQYGAIASITIGISSILFVWVGTKQMLLAHHTGARTYADLNRLLFGDRFGQFISHYMAVVLFGTAAVMLAGAGSIFSEHLHLPYQLGILVTIILAFIILVLGIEAIVAVNMIIVPFMLLFTVLLLWTCLFSPSANNWVTLPNTVHPIKVWIAPLLYTSLNLCMAQTVLVPLGANIKNPVILKRAGWIGGGLMTCLLLASHISLSTQMPEIAQFEIPTAFLVHSLGPVVETLFLIVIYSEIFTTLIADAFGLSHQLQQHVVIPPTILILLILAGGYIISQFGFSTLVSSLYPLFGVVSMIWLVMVVRYSSI